MSRFSFCFVSFWAAAISFSIANAAPFSAVVLDAKTAKVVGGVQYDAPRFPASLTKMGTLYLLFEALRKGKISLSTPFYVSKAARRQPPCKLGLKEGQHISVRACIVSLAVRSSNDVAHVVAENLCGSQEKFVARMNERMKKLGLKETVFSNASGLPYGTQTTTARDMAFLMRCLWVHFPEFKHFLGVPFFSFNGRKMMNTNHLLGRIEGLKMGKTGYTQRSGFNLATLTQRKGRAFIVVVMGGKTAKDRDMCVHKLIEASFSGVPSALSALLKKNNTPPISLASSRKNRSSSLCAEKEKGGDFSSSPSPVRKKSDERDFHIPWERLVFVYKRNRV